MNIHSAEIENFKAISQCEFVANGNNVIISGVCGSGKTSILETLLIVLLGKEALPDDPIRKGAESARITWNLGEGEKIQYTVKVTIKPDKFDLTLTGYLRNGAKCKIASPAAFLKSLIFKDALDPQSFFNKGDKEQLKDFYSLFPDLKAKLENNSLEYKAIQDNRSRIKEQGQKSNIDLERTPYVAGLSEQEVDAAKLMSEMEEAKEHNARLSVLTSDLQRINSAIDDYNERLSLSQLRVERIKAQIEQLELEIVEEEKGCGRFTKEIALIQSNKLSFEKEIAEFKEIPVAPIQEKISNLTKTNESIRQNKRHKELQKEVELLREQYSQGLVDMKTKDQERVDILKSVKMPIEGLTVGDNCLMYPDPATGEIVRLNSLSTGQKWRVAVKILAAFIPENGLRIMVINDLNALDEPNHKAMLEAAKEVSVELVIHQTVYKSDDSQCKITIQGE